MRAATHAPVVSILYRCADYFLRKRSSRTTSAPSPGLAAGSSRPSGAGDAAGGEATVNADGAAAAGRLAAAASLTDSDGSNCRPNCTEGSKKLLMALKGN